MVYKGLNVYNFMSTSGPQGTVYIRSQLRWFDMYIFGDWLKKISYCHMQGLHGKKLVLGGNLSLHIFLEVFELCRKTNTAFVCLPPNSIDKAATGCGLLWAHEEQVETAAPGLCNWDPSAKLLLSSFYAKGAAGLAKARPAAFHGYSRSVAWFNYTRTKYWTGFFKHAADTGDCPLKGCCCSEETGYRYLAVRQH
jgi:hypothetical protein